VSIEEERVSRVEGRESTDFSAVIICIAYYRLAKSKKQKAFSEEQRASRAKY
jgi:hypothetical protein